MRKLDMLPKEIDVQGAAAWLQAGEAILIDVREVEEYRRLRIPGAALLPLSAFNPSQIPPLDGKKLLIHCAMGGRSRDAVIRCRLEGVDAVNVVGGIFSWAQAGLPTESG
ncbi:MAG: rhodanese-like domain-containing protein [Gammaproteobacteria bacterium]|nr:rhodanese-like domain-containing protein [Gammaproteobacteria bacterium]